MSKPIVNKIKTNLANSTKRIELLDAAQKEFNLYINSETIYLANEYSFKHYKKSYKLLIKEIGFDSLEYYNFWYEFFSDGNACRSVNRNQLMTIQNICDYSLWRIEVKQLPKIYYESSIFGGIEQYHNEEYTFLNFEETEMVENIDSIYDKCYKYRVSKNIGEKIVSIKPIIDLIDHKFYKDNISEYFDGAYSEEEILILREKINAVRHASDGKIRENNKFQVWWYDPKTTEKQKSNFLDYVYLSCIEIFSFITKN